MRKWEAVTLILWPPDVKSWLVGKDPDAGKDWGQEEKGTTEDEMAGWHHWLNGHGFGWTLGVGDGQGGLACCGSWGCKESDTTEWLNWTELYLLTCASMPSFLISSVPDIKLSFLGTFEHCWWDYKLVFPLRKKVWKFLKKSKIELPYNPAILLLGIYPKEMKTLTWKRICIPMFTAALFTIAKTWKQSKCPSVDEYIYIYIYIYI